MQADLTAIRRLHGYLAGAHWKDHKLIGPDPGLRLNYRVYRFVKSALRALPWQDDVYFVQAQAYWVLDNWRLFELTGEARFRQMALACSDSLLSQQRRDGGWDYPVRDWKGRTATVEGVWGATGLLATYRQTCDTRYLDAALRWHLYLVDQIGFQQEGDRLAVNYFAQDRRSRVPNNSALLLRFLADLAHTTGEMFYLERCPGLVAFMRSVLLPTGEIPYAVPGLDDRLERLHFQCYQYNAFQALHIMHYYERTADAEALPLLRAVLGFLTGAVGDDGHAYYDCSHPKRTVIYHASALAATFHEAQRLGLGEHAPLAGRAYAFVRDAQQPDGSFPHSRGDYGFLKDARAYPRYLAMILSHMLTIEAPQPAEPEAEASPCEDAPYRASRRIEAGP